jgi:hypothetical protein
MKTFDERKAILEIEITKLLKKGWRITNKGETSCQLQKDKIRDGCLAAILFLLFIIPGIIYLILTPRRTISIYIEVNEEGKINYSSTDISPYQLKQASTLANKDLNK